MTTLTRKIFLHTKAQKEARRQFLRANPRSRAQRLRRHQAEREALGRWNGIGDKRAVAAALAFA